MEKIKQYIKNEKQLLNEEYDLICKLIKARKEEGLSQRDLCELIDFKQPMLARIEKGKQSPSLYTLIKILNSIGYKIEFIKNK